VLPLAGRLAGAKRTQQGSRPRGFSSDIWYDRDVDAVGLAEDSTQTTDKCEVALRSPESLARGMLSTGLPVNPGGLAASPEPGVSVQPDPNEPGPNGSEGAPGKRTDPQRGVPGGKGDQSRRGRGSEQSYEPIVPVKVANRRAPARGGHDTHRREGGNR
jgi:hypothetical protein